MIILRNSKLILTFFNLIHIILNKNYISISININNMEYLVKYFSQNPRILKQSLKIYIIFQEIKKKIVGFDSNLRNFKCILKEFKEIYIILT
jgi:hypothetical protein